MKKNKVTLNDTGLFSNLICDFVNSALKFKFYDQYCSNLNHIHDFIKNNKKKPNSLLYNVLLSQYENTNFLKQDLSLVEYNISLFQKNNTYTITTGHQLNVCANPVFLIYKIISVISCVNYLKKNLPDYNFIPCFWMATEDHDFDEIKNLNLYGKEYTWDINTEDAVGHLPSQSLLSFIDQLEFFLNDSENGNKLLEIYKSSYKNNKIYSDATRSLLTSLFGDYGLVVVDGNHPNLKQLFISDFKDEITNQFVYKSVNKSNNFIKKYYKPQINALKHNIFYLSNNKRQKIIYDKNNFQTSNKEFEWSYSDLLQEIDNYPERFSPNVLLRPLYQERIMNNLFYIGGPSEISYWLQLKIMFDNRKQTFPLLSLRSHFLILSNKISSIQNKIALNDKDLFVNFEEQFKKIILKKTNIKTNDYYKKIKILLSSIELEFKEIDGFPINSFYVFQKKIKDSFSRLESKIIKFEKNNFINIENHLHTINNYVKPNNIHQERFISFIPYYLKYGQDFFDLLIKESSIFNNNYIILTEED